MDSEIASTKIQLGYIKVMLVVRRGGNRTHTVRQGRYPYTSSNTLDNEEFMLSAAELFDPRGF
jgi:hypothetical protein